MTPDSFPQLLGLTNTDDVLIQAVAAHAAGDAQLTPAKIQKFKSDFLMLTQLGVVFSFSARDAFQREYGAPRGEGPRVLSAIFYYPQGSDEVEPYEGPAPLAAGPVETREDAHAAYGDPDVSDGDEGEEGAVEWEQWAKLGVEVSAEYDEDEEVLTLTAALPMA